MSQPQPSPARPAPCTRCASPIEDGDLRCAICALPVPIAERTDHSSRAQVLRCVECGAAIAFSAEAQAPRCGFCGAVMKVEQPVDPIEVAQRRIPFAVDRATAEAAVRGWLGQRGYFAPRTLRDEAVLESLTPLCWAGWIVNAEAVVTWTADSDAGSRRSSWAPHAGEVTLSFDAICVPASRGLDHDECRVLVPHYDLACALPVDGPVIAGEVPAMIERFDAQRSAARAVVQRVIEATAKTRVEAHIPGRRFRNVRVACLLQGQTTDRVALPAWVLAYRYRDAPYRAIVHGQRPEVVFGSSPTDWRKVLAVVGGVAAIIAAIVAIALVVSGCGGGDAPIDAPDDGVRCAPTGAFAPLTGRTAVQGLLNVHVDAGGLIVVDTTTTMLIAMDLVQTATAIAITAEVCRVQVPDVPLAGQELPIQFQIPDPTIQSIGKLPGTATLSSADQTCAVFESTPITVVLGARLEPAQLATAPLPASDDNAVFSSCPPSADTACGAASGIGCACDQEADTKPGATLVAHNVPAIDLDRVYATLRTTFSLHGQVHSTDLVRGQVDATLESGILHCTLLDGMPCSVQNVRLVKALNPIVTPQPANPSTFRAVRVPAATTCADIIANEPLLFPR